MQTQIFHQNFLKKGVMGKKNGRKKKHLMSHAT